MSVRNLAAGFGELHKMATDPTPRIGFGVDYIDSRCNGGMPKAKVAMVMAFSHVGKTALAINAIHTNPHIPILFYSIEMPIEEVTCRLTAMETGLSTSKVESDFRGHQPPDYVQEILDKHKRLLVDDSPDLSMKAADASFESATETLAEMGQDPPRLVIFDFLEKIQGVGLMEKAVQVNRVASQVHTFCRKHRTSGILLHQVGKGDAGGGAELLDLGSGRYGGFELMDLVIGMSRPASRKDMPPADRERLRDQRILQILKNRLAPHGVDEVGRAHRLHPITMRLTDWAEPVLPNWRSTYQEEMFDRELIGA